MELSRKPRGALSVDLDNQWSYMKVHGDPGWKAFPSYLDIVIPRLLEALRESRLRVTFFVVGQDAALDKNAASLALLTRAGHEVGNHSFAHEPWLHLLTRGRLENEITEAEKHILRATGQKPVGFRGPGYSFPEGLAEILESRGYVYDASALPTFIGPLARRYYFSVARLGKEERKKRENLFGDITEGLRPVKPYFWNLPSGKRLVEIPVSTFPVIRTPFHLSYLLYLARYSEGLMHVYLESALRLCRMTRMGLSFLVHPLDVLGGEEVEGLSFFPAMKMSKSSKLRILGDVIRRILKYFDVSTMNDYAADCSRDPAMRNVHVR